MPDGKLPDSMFDDFEALEKELNGGVPDPRVQEQIDTIWKELVEASGIPVEGSGFNRMPSPKKVNMLLQNEARGSYDDFGETDFHRDDPTYVRDIAFSNAKKKMLLHFRIDFFEMEKLGCENFLALTDDERKSLVLWLGLSVKESFSDEVLVNAARKRIMIDTGISEGQNYGFLQVFDFAQKFDRVYSMKTLLTVDGFTREQIPRAFNVNVFLSSGMNAFYFAIKDPEQRRTWLVEKYPLLEMEKQRVMFFLGIREGQKYSIADFLKGADFFDKKGRSTDSIVGMKSLAFLNNLPLYEKKFTADEMVKYVLKPMSGRERWLFLQVKR